MQCFCDADHALDSDGMLSTVIFETYFSNDKDIFIVSTDLSKCSISINNNILINKIYGCIK